MPFVHPYLVFLSLILRCQPTWLDSPVHLTRFLVKGDAYKTRIPSSFLPVSDGCGVPNLRILGPNTNTECTQHNQLILVGFHIILIWVQPPGQPRSSCWRMLWDSWRWQRGYGNSWKQTCQGNSSQLIYQESVMVLYAMLLSLFVWAGLWGTVCFISRLTRPFSAMMCLR